MIDATVLLYMALAAVITTFAFDHLHLVKVLTDAMNKGDEINKAAKDMNEKIQAAHNEQAKAMIDLGKKVVELNNRVEVMAMQLGNRKMFNEAKK